MKTHLNCNEVGVHRNIAINAILLYLSSLEFIATTTCWKRIPCGLLQQAIHTLFSLELCGPTVGLRWSIGVNTSDHCDLQWPHVNYMVHRWSDRSFKYPTTLCKLGARVHKSPALVLYLRSYRAQDSIGNGSFPSYYKRPWCNRLKYFLCRAHTCYISTLSQCGNSRGHRRPVFGAIV